MLSVNCDLTITNLDAADTLRRNLVLLLDVFSMRSFVSVPGVLTRADPAEVCLRPGAASAHGEPRLVTWRPGLERRPVHTSIPERVTVGSTEHFLSWFFL